MGTIVDTSKMNDILTIIDYKKCTLLILFCVFCILTFASLTARNDQALSPPKIMQHSTYTQHSMSSVDTAPVQPGDSLPSIISMYKKWLFNHDRLKIVIHGRYRSGSSFVSDFFRNQDDLLFYFEPMRREYYAEGTNAPRNKTLQVLREIFDCNLDCIYNYNGPGADWLERNVFCGAGSSKQYSKIPGCANGDWAKVKKYAYKNCFSTSIHAVKVIRIPSIEYFMPLVNEGVKVVLLVRDVRGMMASRNAIHRHMTNSVMTSEAEDACTKYVNDLKFIRELNSDYPELQIDKYIYAVRYEDMARNATFGLHKLYQFLGVEPSESLVDWAAGMDKQTEENGTEKTQYDKSNKYSTRRNNPGYTAEAWREKYDFQKVKMIQNVCEEFFNIFGYRQFKDEDLLRDITDTSVRLVLFSL